MQTEGRYIQRLLKIGVVSLFVCFMPSQVRALRHGVQNKIYVSARERPRTRKKSLYIFGFRCITNNQGHVVHGSEFRHRAQLDSRFSVG